MAHERRAIFSDDVAFELLRAILRNVKALHPFEMVGYVFMPNHLHLLIKPKGQETLSTIMHSLKPNFTKTYKAHFGLAQSVSAWQRSFYDHVIRNEKDLYRHLDYVHYNPVKHRYVDRPEDGPHSSYRSWVERGVYPEEWGWSEPSAVCDVGNMRE